MAAGLGKEYNLYASATSKSGGSRFVSGNFTQVLLLTAINLNNGTAEHDISTMDNGFNQALLGGRRSVTLSASGLFNITGDAGQEIFETAVNASTQATKKIYCLFSTDVAGDKEWYFSAIVTQWDISAPDEGPATISITLRINTTDLAGQDAT